MSSSSFPGSGSSLETSVQIWCKVWNEFSLGGDDEVVVQQPKVQSILQLLLSKAQRTNERAAAKAEVLENLEDVSKLELLENEQQQQQNEVPVSVPE